MFKEVEKCHFPYNALFCTSHSATTSAKANWENYAHTMYLMIEINWVVDFINSTLLANRASVQKKEICDRVYHFNSLSHHWLQAEVYNKWWLFPKKPQMPKAQYSRGSPRKFFNRISIYWVSESLSVWKIHTFCKMVPGSIPKEFLGWPSLE